MNLNIPLSGMQQAAQRLDRTANNIANVNSPGYKPQAAPAGNSAAYDAWGLPLPSGVNLNEEMADIVSTTAAYKANAAVVRVEADLTGELLNRLG